MTLYDDIYPFYPLQRTSFTFSGRLLTIALVFLVLAASLLLILPGIRGKSRLLWLFRIVLSFFVGAVIVALNFTCDWAEARMTTTATYKSFSSAVVNAEIGVHVGLYGINVTLKGAPVLQFNETIDYNEMFTWRGTIEEEYEEALEKGLPNPILYIAEKFTSGSTCGLVSQYRLSGRYASATLWIHDAGHGHLRLLLCGLLLYRHGRTDLCFPHRRRLLSHPVQPLFLAGSGYRTALRPHRALGADTQLCDAREDEGGVQHRRLGGGGWRGLPELAPPGWRDDLSDRQGGTNMMADSLSEAFFQPLHEDHFAKCFSSACF
ncbi:dual oxidase maturation factor 2 isoform X1 [Takifugu flavidus]|uniref:dual oxidase maturation factor 2 isoform X1 n=1 Tax=Takifugu flavidus TaxID=433684 RepID=UPI0025443080|nr:dual oxidase maturation factor 2 isoform X1 [Takifugu flavidus]